MNFGSEVDSLKELASLKSDDDHERALSGLIDKVADHSLRPQEPMTSPLIICARKPLEPGGFLESDFARESHET